MIMNGLSLEKRNQIKKTSFPWKNIARFITALFLN